MTADLDRVKRDHLIVDELSRRGIRPSRSYGNQVVYRCPLPGHDDHDPSFTVYRDTNTFKCYGCDKSGSIIDLVALLEDRDPKDVFLLTQTHGKWRELTADDKAKTIRSRYYGLVSHIDAEFGHILDALDQTGQRDNTLIVFTSDHGELLGDHYQYGKRSYFEAAARVPLIVAWPKTLPRNQQREHLAVLQDVFTTVLHAAGVETPDGVYGVNLLPAAADPAAASRDSVVGEFGHLEHAQTSTRSPVSRASTRTVTLKFMWRQDRWKYIYCVNGGRQQLFDIAASRDEIDDQADRRPELCRQFYDNLVAHYQALPGQPFLENSRLPVRPFRYNPALKEEFGVRNFQFPRWPQNERPT